MDKPKARAGGTVKKQQDLEGMTERGLEFSNFFNDCIFLVADTQVGKLLRTWFPEVYLILAERLFPGIKKLGRPKMRKRENPKKH
jgi:hypothetical protein